MENKVYSARIYTNDFNRIISATKAFVAKNGTKKHISISSWSSTQKISE